jgi:hypothetical protein
MAKINKTGRSKSEPRHVRLYEHIERTPAWRDLSGIAAKAWLTIGLMHNGSNNGGIAVSSRELGRRIGVHYVSAARAIRELENAGFLICVKDSSFSQTKRAAEYRLTHIPDNIKGTPATRDYTRKTRNEADAP